MSEFIDNILALCCKICPFCIFARKYPDNKLSKLLVLAEKSCPCCKAYNKIKNKQ